ncbi:MAG: DUF5680 domain-containing protein [Bacilli bacterium]
MFSKKIYEIRKKQNLSQEQFSEKIGVSRQAVTKWELGQTYPEVEKLIGISNTFGVTLDWLLKNSDCTKEEGKKEFCSDEELIQFVLLAKRQTYAAGLGKEKPILPGMRSYVYREEEFTYRDNYVGNEQFFGSEIVWKQKQPIWSMNYAGRVIGDPFSGEFLKDALRNGTETQPYRGPKFYQNGNWTYICQVDGSMNWFQGTEEILYNGETTYVCQFHGGTLK